MKKFIHSHPIEILFSILFLTLAAILNFQFLEGANINRSITGHDEYLTVREVYSIINPLSWKHFILAIIGGDIMFYGRVVFYTDALFAYIPYKIWGLDGMVYAIRMTHSLSLLLGLLILNATFLKYKIHKFLFLFGGFGLYFTLYFVQMPKPEPLQLVFLALFVRGFIKKEYQFGLHFIWLGLSFATKVNAFIILPFMFLIPVLGYWKKGIKINIIQSLKGFLYFFIGYFIGIPCLLLSPIQPVYLQTYLKRTFFGAEKSYDDTSLTAIDWIMSGLGGSYFGNNWVGLVFILFALILLAYLGINVIKTKKISIPFLLLGIGMVFMFFIFMMTKRLWPHYLWTGYIFVWLGILVFVNTQTIKQLTISAMALAILFFSYSTYAFYSGGLQSYLTQEKRASKEIQASKLLYQYIDKTYQGRSIGLDGTVWYPYKHFVLSKPYHPFASERPVTCKTCITWYQDQPMEIWKDDIVIFNKRHPQNYRKSPKNNYTPPKWEEIEARFYKETEKNYLLDTIIGNNWVYKKNTFLNPILN